MLVPSQRVAAAVRKVLASNAVEMAEVVCSSEFRYVIASAGTVARSTGSRKNPLTLVALECLRPHPNPPEFYWLIDKPGTVRTWNDLIGRQFHPVFVSAESESCTKYISTIAHIELSDDVSVYHRILESALESYWEHEKLFSPSRRRAS